MEKFGLGTKSTRHTYFNLLKLRKYIDDNLRVLQQGQRICEICQSYISTILSKEFTKKMEEDLQLIQNGSESSDTILIKYKSLLKELVLNLKKNQQKIRKDYGLYNA